MRTQPSQRAWIAWLVTALASAGCGTINEDSVDAVRLSPELLHGWLARNPDKYLLVDARTPAAYEQGRIPGAIRLDPQDVNPTDPDPRFGKYKAVVVYGEDPSFGRANAITKRLLEAGVSVRMLDGGLKAWRERGYAVEPARP